ncbi:MAG: hypothetical protein ABS35_25700 [Kaistia sp. SCN 65-12]|nr:MAG: hypothetical protein ABS35_25700 [Kaistia sp. SCN 65-12]
MNDWSTNNAIGRDYAAKAIAYAVESENIPLLVRQIREMAADTESGVGAGFLFGLAMAVSAPPATPSE